LYIESIIGTTEPTPQFVTEAWNLIIKSVTQKATAIAAGFDGRLYFTTYDAAVCDIGIDSNTGNFVGEPVCSTPLNKYMNNAIPGIGGKFTMEGIVFSPFEDQTMPTAYVSWATIFTNGNKETSYFPGSLDPKTLYPSLFTGGVSKIRKNADGSWSEILNSDGSPIAQCLPVSIFPFLCRW
jgi:hypothetical protein